MSFLFKNFIFSVRKYKKYTPNLEKFEKFEKFEKWSSLYVKGQIRTT